MTKRLTLALLLAALLLCLTHAAFAARRCHCKPQCPPNRLCGNVVCSSCLGGYGRGCGIKWVAQPIAKDAWLNGTTLAVIGPIKKGAAVPEAAYVKVTDGANRVTWAALAMRTVVQTNRRGQMTKVLRSYAVAVPVAGQGSAVSTQGSGCFGGIPFRRVYRVTIPGVDAAWKWYTCACNMPRQCRCHR